MKITRERLNKVINEEIDSYLNEQDEGEERLLADMMLKVVEKYLDKKKKRWPAATTSNWTLQDIDDILMIASKRIHKQLARKSPAKGSTAHRKKTSLYEEGEE